MKDEVMKRSERMVMDKKGDGWKKAEYLTL